MLSRMTALVIALALAGPSTAFAQRHRTHPSSPRATSPKPYSRVPSAALSRQADNLRTVLQIRSAHGIDPVVPRSWTPQQKEIAQAVIGMEQALTRNGRGE